MSYSTKSKIFAKQGMVPRLIWTSVLLCLMWNRLTWNLMGMMNNPHYRVKVHVDTTSSGQMAMRFEHPTKSGSEAGGCVATQYFN